MVDKKQITLLSEIIKKIKDPIILFSISFGLILVSIGIYSNETIIMLRYPLLIVFVLGLFASIILKKINKSDAQQQKTVYQNGKSAEEFFSDRIPSLKDRLKSVKSINISGITLSRASDSLLDIFENCIKNGGNVRIQLIDPEHDALKIAVKRFHKHQDWKRLQRESYHALDNFEALIKKISKSEQFQLRLCQFSPAYGIWVIDPNTQDSEIWVELYSYKDLPEPTFHLLPYRDGKWFDYFKRQFEIMWDDSIDVHDK